MLKKNRGVFFKLAIRLKFIIIKTFIIQKMSFIDLEKFLQAKIWELLEDELNTSSSDENL